jgi:hypothetical protein
MSECCKRFKREGLPPKVEAVEGGLPLKLSLLMMSRN